MMKRGVDELSAGGTFEDENYIATMRYKVANKGSGEGAYMVTP